MRSLILVNNTNQKQNKTHKKKTKKKLWEFLFFWFVGFTVCFLVFGPHTKMVFQPQTKKTHGKRWFFNQKPKKHMGKDGFSTRNQKTHEQKDGFATKNQKNTWKKMASQPETKKNTWKKMAFQPETKKTHGKDGFSTRNQKKHMEQDAFPTKNQTKTHGKIWFFNQKPQKTLCKTKKPKTFGASPIVLVLVCFLGFWCLYYSLESGISLILEICLV